MTYADALVAFLRAQLDHDEEVATRASFGLELVRSPEWVAQLEDERDPDDGSWRQRWAVVGGNYVRARTGEVTPRWVTHIALHDPAAVHRDVAAKRKAIDMYGAMKAGAEASEGTVLAGAARVRLGAYENVLRALATAYSDRPGFRPEWAPR